MSLETLKERSKNAVKASKENISLMEQLIKEHAVMTGKLDIREAVPDFIANDLTDLREYLRKKDFDTKYVIMKLYNLLYVDDSKGFMADTRHWLKQDNNVDKFLRGILNGFYVPSQNYYLKHIDMSRLDDEYDYYAIHKVNGGITHTQTYKNQLPDWDDSFEFTEQEISNMSTGSYEEIELEIDYD